MSTGSIKEERHANGMLSRSWHCDASGRIHREDGPAMEWFCRDGALRHRSWHCHGKCHREGGPAAEWFRSDGTIVQRVWYRHDKLHREDGPAEEWLHDDGRLKTATYYLDGNRVSREDHRRRMALRKLAASAADRMGVSL